MSLPTHNRTSIRGPVSDCFSIVLAIVISLFPIVSIVLAPTAFLSPSQGLVL